MVTVHGTDMAVIKVVIFDVDGVLVQAERFSDRFAREHGVPVDHVGAFFRDTFSDCLVGRADLKDEIVPYLATWGWAESADAFLDYWFRSEHSVNLELVDHIQSMRSRGVKCVVATNNEKYRVAYIARDMGFSHAFDGLYASAHIGLMKPDVAFFEAVLNDLGVAGPDVLFFDDNQDNVTAAARLGMNSELYKTVEEFRRTLVRYGL